jgi:hypothetical protein
MDCASPSYQLRVSAIIDVQWVFEGSGKPREVWWRAAVKQTCFRGQANGVIGTATIEYEASFGFARSSDKVLLLDNNLLFSNTSGASAPPKHKWRLISEGITDIAGTADDLSDARAPLRTPAAIPSLNCWESRQVFNSGPGSSSMCELVRRVAILERAFGSPHRGFPVLHVDGIGVVGIEDAARVLRFSSFKIN